MRETRGPSSDTGTPTVLMSNWLGWGLGYGGGKDISTGETIFLLVDLRALSFCPSGTQGLVWLSFILLRLKPQMLPVCPSRPRRGLLGSPATTFSIILIGLLLILFSLGHYHGIGTVSGL